MNQKQVEKYLQRIGFTETPELTWECLDRLIHCHLTGVTFENLDISEKGLVPSLVKEEVYEKIVEKGRGGYCFELNLLFKELLEAIGFDVYSIGVKIVWMKPERPPILHRGTVVTINGEKRLADVGYGGPGPKASLPLTDGEYDQFGSLFRVTREGNHVVIDRLHEGGFLPVFDFEDAVFEDVDFVPINYYSAKCDKVLFARERIVNLTTEDGFMGITGKVFKIKNAEGERTEELRDSADLARVLKEYFSMEL